MNMMNYLKALLCLTLITGNTGFDAGTAPEESAENEKQERAVTVGSASRTYKSRNSNGIWEPTVRVDFTLTGSTSAKLKFTDINAATLGGSFTGTVTVTRNGNSYFHKSYTNVRSISLTVPSSGASLTLSGTYRYNNGFFSDSAIAFGYAW